MYLSENYDVYLQAHNIWYHKKIRIQSFFFVRQMEADRIYDNCIQNVESFEKVNRIVL